MCGCVAGKCAIYFDTKCTGRVWLKSRGRLLRTWATYNAAVGNHNNYAREKIKNAGNWANCQMDS